MTARRLLMAAGSGGSFARRGVVSLTAADEGGWTEKPKARALWHGDHTYVGYINGAGDISVVVIPDAGYFAGSPIVLHAALQVDTHAAPALLVRTSDNKLVVLYSQHVGGTMYRRISTNSLDSDPTISGGFAAEGTAFTGSSLTYPMLLERTGESGSPLYVFYRDRATSTSVLAYRKSTDGGATWGTQHDIYGDSGNSTYWDVSIAPDGYRLDFVVTATVGATDQLGSLYHFYADAIDYHLSDGTNIGALGPPFDPSDLTLVYDEADAGKAWSHDLYLNGDGNPVFPFGIADGWSPPGGTDTEYRLAYWDGAAWQQSTILASGGAGQFVPTLACIDPTDETRAYVTRFISGQFELWRYTTADGGATWDAGTAITSGSSDDNLYPIAVKDHPVGGLGVVWMAGTYVSATDYDVGTKGLIG